MSGHQFCLQTPEVQNPIQRTPEHEFATSNSELIENMHTPEPELGFLDQLLSDSTDTSWAVSCSEDRGSKSILYPTYDAEHAAAHGCTEVANNPELQRQLDWGNPNAQEYLKALAEKPHGEGGPARFPELVGQCEYYDARKADFEKRNPGLAAPDYYTEYGKKYCERFSESAFGGLSGAGQEWDIKTRMNLQLAIEMGAISDVDFAKMEKDPEKFREFAFRSHPDAYLEAGLPGLPITDQIMIGLTPDVGDLATWDGVEQVAKTSRKMVPEVAFNTVDSIGRGKLPSIVDPDRAASPVAQQDAPGATLDDATDYAKLGVTRKMFELGTQAANQGAAVADLYPGQLPDAEIKEGTP